MLLAPFGRVLGVLIALVVFQPHFPFHPVGLLGLLLGGVAAWVEAVGPSFQIEVPFNFQGHVWGFTHKESTLHVKT